MTPVRPAVRLTRDVLEPAYDSVVPPRATLAPGEEIVVETHDARGGALDDRAVGSLFELPKPDPARGNPLTGPIAVTGARPGDTLVVDILGIVPEPAGWAGGHAHVNPLAPGRVPRSLGRRIGLDGGRATFSGDFVLQVHPMIGCLGTAPAGAAVHAGIPGRHGGNLDHSIVGAGARGWVPIEVDHARLYLGDVHAVQGDGELSGVALEIASTVTLRVDLLRGTRLAWPWVAWGDRLAVMTAADDFPTARREAVEAMVSALESRYGMEPAEALALLSLAGDLRVGQAFGGAIPMTLRLEVPRAWGLEPGAASEPPDAGGSGSAAKGDRQ
jgi:amidase